MKRINLQILLSSLALSMFSLLGCSDEVSIDSSTRFEGDENLIGYMLFNFADIGGSATRADDPSFDFGDAPTGGDSDSFNEMAWAPDEHHYVVFYSDNFTLPGSSTVYKNVPVAVAVLENNNEQFDNNQDYTGNYTIRYGTVFSIADKEYFEELKPKISDCVVLINTDLPRGQLWKSSKRELLDLTHKVNFEGTPGTILVKGKEYYTASSSVYLSGDNKKVGTVLNTDAPLFNTKVEAFDAALAGNGIATCYVERVVAKVTPTIEPGQDSYIPRHKDYKKIYLYDRENSVNSVNTHYKETDWNVEALGWGLNGIETEYNIFKNVSNKEYYVGKGDVWNSPVNFRTFWGEDPHYDINGETKIHYPHQFRRGLDMDTIRGYVGEHWKDYGDDANLKAINDQYYLRYIPFSKLLSNKFLTNLYAPENTYAELPSAQGFGELGQWGYFTAGTHFLLAAKLHIDGVGEGDIYRDQDQIYYTSKEDILRERLKILNKKMLPGGNDGINILDVDWKGHGDFPGVDKLLKKISWPVNSVLMVDDDGTGTIRPVTGDDMDFIPAEVTGGDGKLLIAPKEKEKKYYIATIANEGGSMSIQNTSGQYISEISYNEVVSLIHKLLGAVSHFVDGYTYYPVPIMHYQYPSTSGSEFVKSLEADTPYIVSKTPGAVGMVRNHWYKINVKSVSKVGRPVDLVNQPIIPMLDKERDYIDATVDILGWHEIDQTGIPVFPAVKE